MATKSANAQQFPRALLLQLEKQFDAATGTTAQKRQKAVDSVTLNRWRHKRIQAEECAAGLS